VPQCGTPFSDKGFLQKTEQRHADVLLMGDVPRRCFWSKPSEKNGVDLRRFGPVQ